MARDEVAGNFANFDPFRVPSPCYVIDIAKLEDNLRILSDVSAKADARVLLALKAFSCFALAEMIGGFLHGTAASGLWEARLGRTRFQGAVHTFAPGLKQDHLAELQTLSDHLIFNTIGQWKRFKPSLRMNDDCAFGLRINPRHSEAENPLYDPCAAWSRLGSPIPQLEGEDLEGLTGFHIHALCDQGFEPFDRLLGATEEKASGLLERINWLNLGGGQMITAQGFDRAALIGRLRDLRRRTELDLYLEPGTAVALNAGALVTEVLDTFWNDGHVAVMDCSATCHMPDVIEAPYTPALLGTETLDRAEDMDPRDEHVVRVGGPTCLAGDVIGTYRFDKAPKTGDRRLFLDQAYYTMVKTTTFNGTPLPSIALWDPRTDDVRVIKQFGYEDFEGRLS
ncbi:carboxynorspermidine decarboxylase [Hwanghaeella grinnelliae]|uniref:Carboxynorspermidine/carboxyspermidine decarboxylase n=2 Tax=Hwanghaeella grinnelliae TaxID=2500179 RepID=A0A3S2VRA7_9PROT|nr:carboxynorspermidine decarboxylase [Hwanghaeella grinnelliae]